MFEDTTGDTKCPVCGEVTEVIVTCWTNDGEGHTEVFWRQCMACYQRAVMGRVAKVATPLAGEKKV